MHELSVSELGTSPTKFKCSGEVTPPSLIPVHFHGPAEVPSWVQLPSRQSPELLSIHAPLPSHPFLFAQRNDTAIDWPSM
mmetsp:Transcript_72107/g.223919  ORF Transcript_72107/g.223919 Transcript_72107/m.223919 type:complete len:80 (+) Transcript_72107:123-362(+)